MALRPERGAADAERRGSWVGRTSVYEFDGELRRVRIKDAGEQSPNQRRDVRVVRRENLPEA